MHSSTAASDRPAAGAPARRSAVHWLALALVWITVASGSVVFTEPAPVDVLTISLVVVLPMLGLVFITRGLVLFYGAWMVAGAFALLSAIQADDLARATIHSTISLYLYAGSFVFAAFVAQNPLAHTRLILHAYLWAAVVAAIAGIIGYFGLVPGTEDLFTRFGRASGTFKDPNVFGPFLVPAIVYAIHLAVSRSALRALLPAAMLVLLSFAVVLSFSRGAWINLAMAVTVYVYLAIVLSPTNWQRLKLMVFVAAGALVAGCGLVALTEVPEIGRVLADRATLTQSYDEGPEGRFGGQRKAVGLIAENPLGIGALEFSASHHFEDVHNVYLSMFLNAGWIGGILFAVLVSMTCVYGFDHALKRTATQPLFLVAYAAFTAHAVEGFVVDIDHWRHFYLLIALIWGLLVSDRELMREIVRTWRPARLPELRDLAMLRARRQRIAMSGRVVHGMNGAVRRTHARPLRLA